MVDRTPSFLGAQSPAVTGLEPVSLANALGHEGLLLLVVVLGVVALGSLAGVIASRRAVREANRRARARASSMGDLLRTVRMAESIADLGFWQYDPANAEQIWSPGMRRMFGIGEEEELVPGDVETLLFASGIDLVGRTRDHADKREPFTLRFDGEDYDGKPRSLLVQACNLRGGGGEVVRVLGVLRDITEQVSRERALEISRRKAERAANQARRLAETDPLTGLANRRRVMSELDRLILAMRASGGVLAVITFDIDRFKRVNDTYGHLAGDRVLERIAAIARGQTRVGDVLGRLGGEEFAWIAPGADRCQAEQLAERLRAAIAHGSALPDMPAVTVSVGLAALAPCDSSLALFARADQALYDAKKSGRNKVVLARAA
ncbi:MAG: diguanylate cyclase [Erythrobacter sp.]|jgi:diguanylate cyclase (GGDEF)-like protein|nr:diguanylate cyclase [Erythrobacter sp.]